MEIYQIKRQIPNFSELSAAAQTMIRYANMDDALRTVQTHVDGIDLRRMTRINSDIEVDSGYTNPMLALRSWELRKISATTSNGKDATFYFVADGSPDGVWSEISTDRNAPKLQGAFAA